MYRRLPEVIECQKPTVRVVHVLKPLGLSWPGSTKSILIGLGGGGFPSFLFSPRPLYRIKKLQRSFYAQTHTRKTRRRMVLAKPCSTERKGFVGPGAALTEKWSPRSSRWTFQRFVEGEPQSEEERNRPTSGTWPRAGPQRDSGPDRREIPRRGRGDGDDGNPQLRRGQDQQNMPKDE